MKNIPVYKRLSSPMNKNLEIVVYIPSTQSGKAAQKEAYTFADSVEHKLGIKVIRLECQLAYDLHPEFSEADSEEFCLNVLYKLIARSLE